MEARPPYFIGGSQGGYEALTPRHAGMTTTACRTLSAYNGDVSSDR